MLNQNKLHHLGVQPAENSVNIFSACDILSKVKTEARVNRVHIHIML